MRRGLQIVLGVLSLIPLAFGSLNMLGGAALFLPAEAVTSEIDSQFRFQSAYYLGLAPLIWWMIPRIERVTVPFRILIAALFLGGVTRLYSALTLGWPEGSMLGGMILELALPVLILWQARIAVRD